MKAVKVLLGIVVMAVIGVGVFWGCQKESINKQEKNVASENVLIPIGEINPDGELHLLFEQNMFTSFLQERIPGIEVILADILLGEQPFNQQSKARLLTKIRFGGDNIVYSTAWESIVKIPKEDGAMILCYAPYLGGSSSGGVITVTCQTSDANCWQGCDPDNQSPPRCTPCWPSGTCTRSASTTSESVIVPVIYAFFTQAYHAPYYIPITALN